MLGRLIKHEWKSTYKVGCLMLAAMAVTTFLGWMSFQTPMWRSMGDGGGRFIWLDIFGAFTLVMYVVLLVVINSGIVIYVGVHFYKTMYTDEGYLLHTLPVTKHEILFCKILVGGLWVLIIVFSGPGFFHVYFHISVGVIHDVGSYAGTIYYDGILGGISGGNGNHIPAGRAGTGN